MVRLALLALSAAAIPTFMLVVEKAAAQASRPSGFELPAIKQSSPGHLFQFEGERAKLLVREVLPIVMNDVARVSVRQTAVLPGGHYWGLTIDVALNVRVDFSASICEEPHVYITFQYKGAYVDLAEVRPTVRGGAIADHAFDRLFLRNRYFTMSEKGVSHEHASASCRSLATDTSGWREASNMMEYVGEKRRTESLINALATLPISQIHCLNPQGSACNYHQSEILSLVQTSPPDQSESVFVPNEGAVTVYRHKGYNDAAQLDYIATLRSGEANHPSSLSIRFSKSLPPPAI